MTWRSASSVCEMLLPEMVERLDQDILFELDPALGIDQRQLGRHFVVGQRLQPLDDRILLDRFLGHPLVDRRVEAEDRGDIFLERRRRSTARDRSPAGMTR